jgi:hypothetical protein
MLFVHGSWFNDANLRPRTMDVRHEKEMSLRGSQHVLVGALYLLSLQGKADNLVRCPTSQPDSLGRRFRSVHFHSDCLFHRQKGSRYSPFSCRIRQMVVEVNPRRPVFHTRWPTDIHLQLTIRLMSTTAKNQCHGNDAKLE